MHALPGDPFPRSSDTWALVVTAHENYNLKACSWYYVVSHQSPLLAVPLC